MRMAVERVRGGSGMSCWLRSWFVFAGLVGGGEVVVSGFLGVSEEGAGSVLREERWL
jgi:hypothetical protein